MAKHILPLLDRAFHFRILRRWTRWAQEAEVVDLKTLRALRRRGRQINSRVNELLYVAESRLALPRIGSTAIQKPMHSDWAWRPELWRGPLVPPGRSAVKTRETFGREVSVFHDCEISELTIRQLRNQHEADLAPFGLRMDVFRFDGSFLSLVIELPESAAQGFKLKHLLRLDAIIEMEKPLEIFARLNIKHGPNTEQVVRELPLISDNVMVEFDLSYTKMNEKRVERVWIDLIFEGPEMNQIILRDLTLSRRPRAEL
ncbi:MULTISPECIES: DUF6478 family protein [Falsihalocynthiibacter]|uniref:DUF6478 family protein n=1 Tax=Falsihalocynthiibacter TaxID=2854182 RepID=UPI0030027A23